jgi:hypothetical protein
MFPVKVLERSDNVDATGGGHKILLVQNKQFLPG